MTRRLAPVLIGSACALVAAGDPTIPLSRRSEVRAYYTNLVDAAARSELISLPAAVESPAVAVEIEFDDAKFAADSKAHVTQSRLTAAEKLKRQRTEEKSLLADLAWLTPPTPKSEFPLKPAEARLEAEPGDARFGKLNIDLDFTSMTEIALNEYAKEQERARLGTDPRPVALSLAVPPVPKDEPTPFEFDALAYVKTVAISVALPAAAPEGAEDRLVARLKRQPEIAAHLDLSEGGLKVLRRSAPPAPATPSWGPSFVQPGNLAFGIVLAAAVLGVLILGSAFLLSRAPITRAATQQSADRSSGGQGSGGRGGLGDGATATRQSVTKTAELADEGERSAAPAAPSAPRPAPALHESTPDPIAPLPTTTDARTPLTDALDVTSDASLARIAESLTADEAAHLLASLPITRAHIPLRALGAQKTAEALGAMRVGPAPAAAESLAQRLAALNTADTRTAEVPEEEAVRMLLLALTKAQGTPATTVTPAAPVKATTTRTPKARPSTKKASVEARDLGQNDSKRKHDANPTVVKTPRRSA